MRSVLFDLPRMADLAEITHMIRVFGDHYACDPQDPGVKAVMELYVRGDRKGGVVARDGDRMVGFALYDITPMFAPNNVHGRGDLCVVHPDYRRQGIAGEMIRMMWEQAAERGVVNFLNKSSVPTMIEYYRRQPEMTERGVYFHKTLHPASTSTS